ncbi:MAG TPA: histidine phosphatase family protein [Tepidisphaeraceae bacterium]|jgi:phosphohistidine phosphatase SixA
MSARSPIAIAVLLFLLCGSPHAGRAAPAADGHGPRMVMIIRHAEKPDDAENPDLASKGRQRAEAIAKQFVERFPRPDFILATARSKNSNRPVETVEPLAKSLHLRIEAGHKNAEFEAVAHDVLADPRFAGKVVLICWHHGKIPDLARALGAAEAPAKWDPNVFDRVWEIDYDNGAAKWHDRPEQMLPGDSTK